MEDDLVHVVDWPKYLHYVREDKVHTDRWRPPFVNLPVAELGAVADELTLVELGAFARLLLAYASAPLDDPAGGPLGERRLTYRAACRRVALRNGAHQKVVASLERAGLVRVDMAF